MAILQAIVGIVAFIHLSQGIALPTPAALSDGEVVIAPIVTPAPLPAKAEVKRASNFTCEAAADPDAHEPGPYCECNDGTNYYTYPFMSGTSQCAYSAPTGTTTVITPTVTTTDQIMAYCTGSANVNQVRYYCWDELHIPDFVNNWWNENQATCGAKYNGKFDTCFQALNNISTQSCEQVNTQTCTSDALQPLSNNVTAWYVAYNIFSINNFYTVYYNALQDAANLAEDGVGNIIQLFDPAQKANTGLGDLLSALAVGLAFIPDLPEGFELEQLVKNVITATQQAPGLVKALLPGTVDSQVQQLATLQGQLGNAIKQLTDGISSDIPTALNSTGAFLSVATGGAFSQPPVSQNQFRDYLLQGLNTYVVSLAFQANNIVIGRGPGSDPHALQSNGSQIPYDLGCSSGYDSNSICGPWYWDPKATTSYGPTNLNDGSTDYTSALQTLFNSNNSMTPDQLFGGAQRCADAAKSTQGAAVNFTQGPLGNPDCLSNVKLCTWDVQARDSTNEFADCSAGSGYAVDLCSDSVSGGVSVPPAYLGGWIYSQKGDTPEVCKAYENGNASGGPNSSGSPFKKRILAFFRSPLFGT